MKYIFSMMITILILPSITLADANVCADDGYSIIYINGILTNFNSADENKETLQENFIDFSKYASKITTYLGHNPTRGSVIDIPKTALQTYWREDKYQSLDLDATNILKNVHGDIKTKKILLLGHSQGTFYTNQLYSYLIRNGVSKDSISVYNIGTPASFVAGNGSYITNKTDNVINKVRLGTTLVFSNKPLPSNTHIAIQDKEGDNESRGHSLQRVYLAGEGERIVREIDALLSTLKTPENPSNNGQAEGCFNKPKMSLQAGIESALVNTPQLIAEKSERSNKQAMAFAKNTTDRAEKAVVYTGKKAKQATLATIGGMVWIGDTIIGGVKSVTEATKNQLNNIISLSKKEIHPRYEQRDTLDEPIIPAQETSTKEQQELPRQIQKKKQVTIPTEAIQPTMSYEQMSLLLSQLKIMLEDKLVLLQPRDKCAGIDLSIMKYSTCLSPFEEGGFGFGAGGGSGLVCPDGNPSQYDPGGFLSCIPPPPPPGDILFN